MTSFENRPSSAPSGDWREQELRHPPNRTNTHSTSIQALNNGSSNMNRLPTRPRQPPDETGATLSMTIQQSTSNQRNGDLVRESESHHDAGEEGPWVRKTMLTFGKLNIRSRTPKPFLKQPTDGGGVRGYSSLLILRRLMEAISDAEKEGSGADCSVHPLPHRDYDFRQALRRRTSMRQSGKPPQEPQFKDASKLSRYLPCHYFDYVAGTSTGGSVSCLFQ